MESLAVRKAAASFKSVSGIPNKIKLAYTMLTLPAWRSFNLTVNFFSTKYQKYTAGCPSLPGHMKVKVCPMDELPRSQEHNHFLGEGEDSNCDGDENFDCIRLVLDKSVSEDLTDFDHMSAHYRNCTSSSIQSERLCRMQAIEENSDPSCLSYSPPNRRSSVSATAYSDEEETIIDKNKFQPTAEICAEVGWQNRKQKTTRGEAVSKQTNPYCLMEETLVAFGGSTSCQLPTTPVSDKGQAVSNGLPISHDVEVIDILTPLSCRINSYTKKRRVASVCPQIIDLTKSPDVYID
ncbi:hypothetical protein RJ641_008899 [Dillenia turbinata]|uniref:Uncharacterized protein n=1 Tax=Dillenia turbinata TaxID=194707 RepID=A0AAN8Z9D9_9MAGN